MIAGMDVSIAQGTITDVQWRTLRSRGVRFCYAKCGNGNNRPDPSFAANIAGIRAAGIVAGAYHVGFPLPTTDEHPDRDPGAQALSHFTQSSGLGTVGGTLPPALDLEWPQPGTSEWTEYGCTPQIVRTWARGWLLRASLLYARTPVIYTYPSYWAYVMHGASDLELAELARYPLWLADQRYGAPLALPPWKSAAIWQKSDGGGHLPPGGISNGAPYDENVWMADDASWLDFVLGKPVE